MKRDDSLQNYSGSIIFGRGGEHDMGIPSWARTKDPLIKFRKNLRGQEDFALIKSLFEIKNNKLKVLDDFKDLDMEIKAMDYGFLRDFKAYMSNRFKSKNTPAIHLRSLQAIMNDAGKTYPDLKDHKPLSGIKKQNHENAPAPLDLEDINAIRKLKLENGSPIWDTRNYLLFMFNNMGMNHFDMAILKRFQFEDNRIKYFRKKTHYEGDYFSVLQNEKYLTILLPPTHKKAPARVPDSITEN